MMLRFPLHEGTRGRVRLMASGSSHAQRQEERRIEIGHQSGRLDRVRLLPGLLHQRRHQVIDGFVCYHSHLPKALSWRFCVSACVFWINVSARCYFSSNHCRVSPPPHYPVFHVRDLIDKEKIGEHRTCACQIGTIGQHPGITWDTIA